MQSNYTLKNLMTIFFLLCMNFSSVIGFSQFHLINGFQQIQTLLIFCAMIGLVFSYFPLGKIQLKSLFLVTILFCIAILYFGYTGNLAVFRIILFILISKGISVERILSYNNFTLLFVTGLIILSSFVGLTDMNYYGDINKVYSFGFQNPNSLPVIIFTIMTGFNLIKRKNLTKTTIFLELMIVFLAYYLFKNRTATITLSIYLILLMLSKKISIFKFFRWLLKPWQYLFIVETIITCYVAYIFNSLDPTWYNINFLLSWRLSYWQNFLMTFDINLLGNSIIENHDPLDNAYMYILVFYGIIMLIIFNCIFTYISRFAYENRDWGLFFAIIAYEIYCFGESAPLSFNLCSVLLVFSCMIMNKKRKDKVYDT